MPEILYRFVTFLEREERRILIFLIAAVAIAGAAYSFSLGTDLRFRDERVYYRFAKNIAEHRSFSFDGGTPTAYRPPGYSFFLSLFLSLGADIVFLRLLNFAALGISIYLLNRLLREHAAALAAVLGALLVVAYPVLFYAAGTLYPQTLGAALLLFTLLLLMRKQPSYGRFALAGLAYGYLVLAIPTFFFLMGVLVPWFAWSRSRTRRAGIAVMVAAALLPIGIWCARNYAVFDTFVFISTKGGAELLYGNSEHTTPTSSSEVDVTRYALEADRLGLEEVERDRFFRNKAIEYILSHKARIAKLYSLKFLNYFNYRNELSTETEESSLKDLVMLLTYGPLLLLFVTRLLFIRAYRPSALEVLLIVLYIASGLVCAIFLTRIRYRLPFDYLLIGVVAIFLSRLAQTWLARRRELLDG